MELPSTHNGNSDEESFIILGSSSPQNSIDAAIIESKIMECSKSSKSSSGLEGDRKSSAGSDFFSSLLSNGHGSPALQIEPIFNEEILKYNGGSPKVSSSMCSAISFEGDLESKVFDLLKENKILKETLANNNSQMKEQFQNIAKWQDDMMKTHRLHKVKFGETKVLIEKLRIEKAELKKKLDHECELNDEYRKHMDQMAIKVDASEKEIVNIKKQCDRLTEERDKLSKDVLDVNKVLLSKISKLEMAVKENETIKKELDAWKQTNANGPINIIENPIETNDDVSVSSIGDSFIMAETKNSQLHDSLDKLSLQLEMVEKQRRQVILENDKIYNEKELLEENVKQLMQENSDLKLVIKGIEEKTTKSNAEELNSMKQKMSSIMENLSIAQEKLSKAENTEKVYVRQNSETQDKIKQLSENIVQLKERLRESLTITFQPVRYSISLDSQDGSSEFANFMENVKLYDKTLKELATYLNQHSQAYGELFDKVNTWLMDVQLNKDSMKIEQFVANQEVKIESVSETINGYIQVVSNLNHQVKSSLSFFEKIFLDYQQILMINKDFEVKNVKDKEKLETHDHLVAKIVQLEMELSKEKNEKNMLVEIVKTLQKESDERELLKAQLVVYKTDFEAERESRACLASEKEEILSNLQELQKRNHTLVSQLEQASKAQPSTTRPAPARPVSSGVAYANSQFQEVYTCPKCNLHTIEYSEMDRHLMACLELK